MLASSFSGQDIIGRLSRSSEGLIDLLRRWDRDGSGKATRDDFWRAMRTLDLSAGDGEIDWAYTYLADDNDDQLVDVFTLAEKLQPNAVQRAAKLLLHEAEGTDLDLSSRSKTWVDLVPPRKEAVAPPGEGALQAPAHPSDLGMAGDAANGEALPQREPVGTSTDAAGEGRVEAAVVPTVARMAEQLGGVLDRLEKCLVDVHAHTSSEQFKRSFDLKGEKPPIFLDTRTVHEEMRRLFHRFSTAPPPPSSSVGSRSGSGFGRPSSSAGGRLMTPYGFRSMAKTAQLVCDRCSVADVDLIFMQVCIVSVVASMVGRSTIVRVCMQAGRSSDDRRTSGQ